MMGYSQALSLGHPQMENTLLYVSELLVNGDLRAIATPALLAWQG